MIVYLDASAVVKLFVAESGSKAVRELVGEGQPLTTHVITYAEACAAFARLARDRTDRNLYTSLRAELDTVCGDWEWVLPDWTIIRRAADHAEGFGLRGYDSVHLAAAEAVAGTIELASELTFGCFDQRLAAAGASLGFRVLQAG